MLHKYRLSIENSFILAISHLFWRFHTFFKIFFHHIFRLLNCYKNIYGLRRFSIEKSHEIINLEMTPKKGGCAETSNHICSHMFMNVQYFHLVSLGNVKYVIANSQETLFRYLQQIYTPLRLFSIAETPILLLLPI